MITLEHVDTLKSYKIVMLLKGSAVILLVLLSCAPLRNLYAHIELTGSLCTCMKIQYVTIEQI